MIGPRENLLLAPFSALYGALMRARLALYRAGALPVHKIEAPVISVGNITAGGTGKTPLVAWLAGRLALEGRRVSILTRGYGRTNPKAQVVVSDGEKILAEAVEGGDEPRMLAEMLIGKAAVISDADRLRAARLALARLHSDAFILDDGFQHLRLARDLNIVVIDGSNPFGGRRLLPRGLLREPLENLSRADCIVISRADLCSDADLASLRAELARLSGNRPLFLSRVEAARLRPLFEDSPSGKESSGVREQPSAAFCAIGNPAQFFREAKRAGLNLVHTRAFMDHHVYTQGEVESFEDEARKQGARALLTTAKDAVKLRALSFELPCYVLEIEIRFDEEEAFWALVKRAISGSNPG